MAVSWEHGNKLEICIKLKAYVTSSATATLRRSLFYENRFKHLRNKKMVAKTTGLRTVRHTSICNTSQFCVTHYYCYFFRNLAVLTVLLDSLDVRSARARSLSTQDNTTYIKDNLAFHRRDSNRRFTVRAHKARALNHTATGLLLLNPKKIYLKLWFSEKFCVLRR